MPLAEEHRLLQAELRGASPSRPRNFQLAATVQLRFGVCVFRPAMQPRSPLSTIMQSLSDLRHLLRRAHPLWPTTFSQCQCGRAAGRGGDPCVECITDSLAQLVGRDMALRYRAAVRLVRDLESEMEEVAG